VSCTRTNLYRKPHPFKPGFRGRILTRTTLAAAAAAVIVTAAPGPLSVTSAFAATATSTTHARLTAAQRNAVRNNALGWAYRQAGKWYCYGGTGPSCYDCSGLVVEAYQHAGISLPRTTYGMLSSPRLHWIPARDRRPGDLAFYGPGHVELVTPRYTFGAQNAGTRVWWHSPSQWWYPTMYFEVW